MTLYVHVVDESPVRLWGLSSHERIRRLLRGKAPVRLVDDLEAVPEGAFLLLLRGDYLFDSRIVRALADGRSRVLQVRRDGKALNVAAHIPAQMGQAVRDSMRNCGDGKMLPADVEVVTPESVCPAYQAQLLKSDVPFVLPITTENRRGLEDLLFGAAYKGITDLVTKWIWPVPASWGVRLCVGLGLSPNHVTTLSWILAVAAGLLFWEGRFAWGLALGWFMTYLDTVDGKLARVTVTSSQFGHLFDHILDLFHPPFWYLAWGLGLATYEPLLLPPDLQVAVWIIFVGYLVGRLVEGGFRYWMANFGIFAWRKVDSYSRLITARRNPCLILLTVGAVTGRPDLGLEAVAVWTLLSSLFLVLRLAMALYARRSSGPLTSWLEEVERNPRDRSLAVRWFTGVSRRPASTEST